MEAIRKIIKVKKNSITFAELSQFNEQEVECIIMPATLHAQIDKSKLLKFAGCLESGHRNTSEIVDELIYCM